MLYTASYNRTFTRDIDTKCIRSTAASSPFVPAPRIHVPRERFAKSSTPYKRMPKNSLDGGTHRTHGVLVFLVEGVRLGLFVSMLRDHSHSSCFHYVSRRKKNYGSTQPRHVMLTCRWVPCFQLHIFGRHARFFVVLLCTRVNFGACVRVT